MNTSKHHLTATAVSQKSCIAVQLAWWIRSPNKDNRKGQRNPSRTTQVPEYAGVFRDKSGNSCRGGEADRRGLLCKQHFFSTTGVRSVKVLSQDLPSLIGELHDGVCHMSHLRRRYGVGSALVRRKKALPALPPCTAGQPWLVGYRWVSKCIEHQSIQGMNMVHPGNTIALEEVSFPGMCF